MTSKTSFKIIVEENDLRLEAFLTESGDLAFHITNTAGTLDACIEADPYLFERGLEALIDTLEDENDECGCGHDHHHHVFCCDDEECCDDDECCDECDEDDDEEEEQ